MEALDLPANYEVSISDELRAIAGRFRRAAPRPGGPAIQLPQAGARRYTLRRDGHRPMIVVGFEVLRLLVDVSGNGTSAREGAGEVCLAVYGLSDGACVAHVAAIPPAGVPGRPIFQARAVSTAADILCLLDETGPARCWLNPVGPDTRAAPLSAFMRLGEDLFRAIQPFLKHAA
ncbi:MAG: hypothetical protein AAFQ79_11585 [Pseudomonadota bacterium]